jgi:hypothetical protein
VKAKSFNPQDENIFGKNGGLSGWKPYLFDLQKFVAQKTPQFKFEAYLLMADKTKKSKY